MLGSVHIGLLEIDPSSTQTTAVVSMFTEFADSARSLRRVTLQNANTTDEHFLALYNDLLIPAGDALEEIGFHEWDGEGSLTDAILDEVGTLTSLTALEISGHALTTTTGLETLTDLDWLHLAWTRGLLDFSGLSSMTRLRGLAVPGTGFDDDDFGALVNLSKMQELYIDETQRTETPSPLWKLQESAFSTMITSSKAPAER